MPTRKQIVDFAKSQIGQPYRHQGRGRGGFDCAGILVAFGVQAGMYNESKEDLRYTTHPETFSLKDKLEHHMERIPRKELAPGDVVLFKLTRLPQHVGIVFQYSEQSLGIIHTYETVGRVVAHRLNKVWEDRIVACYKLPGVCE